MKQVKIYDVSQLKVGDYIKYDTGVSTVGYNGIITCRVLYSLDSPYGLQIISNQTLGEKVTLGGADWETAKESYNKAIETLNQEAEKYINEKYAFDARSVGSIPKVQNGMFVDKNKIIDKEENIVSNTVILPISEWTSYTRPTTWINDDTGCYEEDFNYISDYEALGTTMRLINEQYWLASHITEKNASRIRFNTRTVNIDGELYSGDIGYIGRDGTIQGYSSQYGIRPCISLKSDIIKIIDGDGTEESPYIIEK